MNNKEMDFRHELKYQINMTDYLTLRQKLALVAETDAHAGVDGKYRIRSLYFETPDDKVLREKLYGLNIREKFRIRYYNDDTAFIRLEKKTKINGLGNKLNAPLTKEQCESLITGDTQWMKDSHHPLILELYAKIKGQQLRPKTIVDYIREPFIYGPGNVRVTFDSQIRTGIHSKDLFNQELPSIRTNMDNTIVMEVKYDDFLPEIIRVIVQLRDRKATAFSKYTVSRIFG